ncbi:MAG: hypothetical protein HY287_15060 [Planctomycetes bacterium]|nr:hypothetical protein [Planctomycetota bacterium]
MKQPRSDILDSHHLQNLIWGAERGAFESELGRTLEEIEQLGAGNKLTAELVDGLVHPLRVRDAFGNLPPFRVPRLRHCKDAISLGRSLARATSWIPASMLTAGLLIAGNTGSGKSNIAMRLALRLARFVNGLWFAEMYKTDFRRLRPAFQRRGRELIILSARRSKFNVVQADGDPHAHLALGVDVLCRGLELPPLAGIILRTVWHALYERFGIYRGNTDAWPTLYDIYEEIRAADLNTAAKNALLDRLASLLRALTPQVAAYRLAWSPSQLTRHFIAFEFNDASEHVKSILVNYLLFSVLQHRINAGRSNAPLDFACFFDDAQRFAQIGVSAGSSVTPLTELAGLIRGTGTGVSISCQSLEGLPAGLRANLATKCMCRLGASSDWQTLGADMGMTAEKIRWAQQHLRPGLSVWQLADGKMRFPFAVETPRLKDREPVTEFEAAESAKALDCLPTKPAEEFMHWEPVPVITITTKKSGPQLTTDELRFLQAVIDQPGAPSSTYATLVGMSGKTAVRIRRLLVERGYLREHSVAIRTRGRAAILLEPLTPALAVLGNEKGL